MKDITIEMNVAEAQIALGVISDRALESSRLAAGASGEEREIMDLSSRMLNRIATAIVDALYPTCQARYSEAGLCGEPAVIAGYCEPHARFLA